MKIYKSNVYAAILQRLIKYKMVLDSPLTDLYSPSLDISLKKEN